MVQQQDRLPEGGFAAMVPELGVKDFDKSLSFWCDVLGFSVAYQRPESKFAYLEREGAQFMLEEVNGNWGVGALERPYGRGINFQIGVSSVAPIIESLQKADWPLFKEVHDAWYRIGGEETGCRQFLVQDPDGYLLRFSEHLGLRPL